MPYLGISGQEYSKKPFLYFKSAPPNLSNCKILPKEKALDLGQKLPYLGIFGQEI